MKVADSYAETAVNTFVDEDVVISLHTADPGLNGANEITGGHRITLTQTTDWNSFVTSNGNRVITNANEEEFTDSASADEIAAYFTIWDATETDAILSAPITNPQTITTGNPIKFPAGSFTFGMKVDTTV